MLTEYVEFAEQFCHILYLNKMWVAGILYMIATTFFVYKILQYPVENFTERLRYHLVPIMIDYAFWFPASFLFSLVFPLFVYGVMLILPVLLFSMMIVISKWGYDKWVTTQSIKRNPSTSQD